MRDHDDVHVGFVVSHPAQLVDFALIRRQLTGQVSVFIVARGGDPGPRRQLVEEHLGPCRITWVPSDLTGLDAECDVIVSHTPSHTPKTPENSPAWQSPTGWKSLTHGLDGQPWPGKAKKIIRRSLQRLPGGDRAVRTYWSARARHARASPDAVNSESRADPQSLTPLSEVAYIRRQQTVHLVSARLTEHAVPHRTDASAYWAYIAVRAQDLDMLHAALRSLDEREGTAFRLWMGAGTHYSTATRADRVELSDLAAAESIVAGIPLTIGSYSVRRSGGVEILILDDRDGRLIARRARARKTEWTQEFASVSAEHPSSESSDLIVREADELVDVVYTWVDSSDPEWTTQRDIWSNRTEILMDSAANDERYLDRDELKYSLRSLALYAPFVRNIHIVTNGHRPSWLVEDERIRIVPHTEIFPDLSVLPTFNSHAIEACLHRIPGLSENFLYFNDDVFLGRDAELGDFYTMAGLIKSRFSPVSVVAADRPALDAAPIDWASYNAVTRMGEEFGLRFDRKHKHVPHAMKKSMLEELEARLPDVFDQTRSSRFRDHTDYAIPSMLAHYYGIATHQAVEWPHVPKEYAYADSGRLDFESRLEQIIETKPLFFCLNVTDRADHDFETQAGILQRFLSERFPIPSPWEVAPASASE